MLVQPGAGLLHRVAVLDAVNVVANALSLAEIVTL
jgi:hypothetical protein